MPHPVDIHVGKKVRHRRWLLGMSQTQLAEQVDIKFQQIQKYETGANRISASRLWDIATVLDVPVHFFFDGLEDVGNDVSSTPDDFLENKEVLQLVAAYYGMPDNHRKQLFELAKVLSA